LAGCAAPQLVFQSFGRTKLCKQLTVAPYTVSNAVAGISSWLIWAKGLMRLWRRATASSVASSAPVSDLLLVFPHSVLAGHHQQ
jgi:hypothetical protein